MHVGIWKMYFGNPLRGYVVADYLLVEYAKIQSVISQQYMNIEHNNGHYFYFSTKSRKLSGSVYVVLKFKKNMILH